MNGEQDVIAAADCTPQTSDEFLALLRKWKGANGNLLIVLVLRKRGMTAVELEQELGYSDKPVRQMLREMEEVGLVEHHGRAQGWTMTMLGWFRLSRWIADGRPTGSSENPRYLGTDLIRSESDLTEDINNYQSDLIKSDLKQPSKKNDGDGPEDKDLPVEEAAKNGSHPGEREVLRTFLERIKIEDPAFSEILNRDKLVDVVAWHWSTLGKTWIANPRGWVIHCLEKGDAPQVEYLECARVWLGMSEEEYDDYLTAKTNPSGAFEYWEERVENPGAVEVFDRARRHGGLELFDDYDRPILADEG